MDEHWDRSLRQLAYDALKAAMNDANVERVDALYALATRAGPYRKLSRAALESVLDMLSGRYQHNPNHAGPFIISTSSISP